MTFTPVLPAGGVIGWRFLNRTLDQQAAAHAGQAAQRRDEAYFRERINSIGTAADLVADPRLLRVALTAFGLEGDARNKFFVRKVLEDGTLDPRALSNRLADKRYRAFSAAFGFGDFSTPRTRLSDFADTILPAFKERAFEAAVGVADDTMRLSLNARREVSALARQTMTEDAKWFTVMGNPPLRKVFETALGLPSAFGALDIDRQLGIFKDKAARVFGAATVSQFADPATTEALIRRYLLRADPGAGQGAAPGTGALQLLQSAASSRRTLR